MNYKQIEKETLYEKGFDEYQNTTPFDPRSVDIVSQTMVISNIIERLKEEEIVIPDFQRNEDLWDEGKQSRLIESLIIRIPIPTFYFDYSVIDDKYYVVDGLQRLTAIKRFAVLDVNSPRKLRLVGLEYLKELEGKMYEELPLGIQRRIREESVLTYIIRPGTPENVRNSIFTRINTGGMQLTPAEIKNSVYRGKAAELLKELAHSDEFINATGGRIDPDRMLDREFVNRFLAFNLLDLSEYNDNLEEFLNLVLIRIKQMDSKDISEIRNNFLLSMKRISDIFGDCAFRRIDKSGKYSKINKPLFECVSVIFAKMDDETFRQLKQHKDDFIRKYNLLLLDDDFIEVLTSGTARKSSIEKRNKALRAIIKEIIG